MKPDRKILVKLSRIILSILIISVSVFNTSFSFVKQSDKNSQNDKLALENLPLSFIPNKGQFNSEVLFQTGISGGSASFTNNGVVYTINILQKGNRGLISEARASTETLSDVKTFVLSLEFQNTNLSAEVTGGNSLPGIVNYLMGADSKNWITGINTYNSVTYEELYQGIDLTYDSKNSALKGTYSIEPGSDPDKIKWVYNGDEGIKVDPDTGELKIKFGEDSVLTENKPVSWQEINGRLVPVEVSFVIDNKGTVGFSVGNYDPNYTLIVDPTLTYSTYFGGSQNEGAGYGFEVDNQGNVYITGDTGSTNLPISNALQPQHNGGEQDVFVSKIDPYSNTLIYSTYLGGSERDTANRLTIDGNNNVYVTGFTRSSNFPVVNALYPQKPGALGDADAFILKLDSTGSSLVFSTYLGGTRSDDGWDIEINSQGEIIVVGITQSFDFPVQNAIQPTRTEDPSPSNAVFETFITKLNPSATQIVFSTYLGGSGNDVVRAVAVDNQDDIYTTGETDSEDYPVQNQIQTNQSSTDIFISKINSAGTSLIFSSYIGGSGQDRAWGIAADENGNSYITGNTNSTNFPMVNPYDSTFNGRSDVFIVKINSL